ADLRPSREQTERGDRSAYPKRWDFRAIRDQVVEVHRRPEWMAGAGGIEPPNGGIKIRCLTAWLRPNGAGRESGDAANARRPRRSIGRTAPIQQAAWRICTGPVPATDLIYSVGCARDGNVRNPRILAP